MAEENLTSREVARRKITAFYARLFPEKLHTVDQLLDKYVGEEDDVIRTHKIKYPIWNWDYVPPPMSISSHGGSTRQGTPQQHNHNHNHTHAHSGDFERSGGAPPPVPPRRAPGGAIDVGTIPGKDHNLNITLTLNTPGGDGYSVAPYRRPDDYAGTLPHSSSHNTDAPFEDPRLIPVVSPRPGVPNYTPLRPNREPSPPAPLAPPTSHHPFGPPPPAPPASSGPLTLYEPVPPQPIPHGAVGFPAHPDASQLVSRNEIENAFAALESKLTEAQRQDVAVLEAKLDQLLDQISGKVKSKDSDVQRQLHEMMMRIDQLSQMQAAPPMHTTPSPAQVPTNPPSEVLELQQKVKMLESHMQNSQPQVQEPEEGGQQNWREAVNDYVDLLKQENSKKSAEIDLLANSAQSLQQQLGQQQMRYTKDVTEMQRKLSALEGHQSALQENKDLAHKLHSAVSQAANAQHQAQSQHKQLLDATSALMAKQSLPPQTNQPSAPHSQAQATYQQGSQAQVHPQVIPGTTQVQYVPTSLQHGIPQQVIYQPQVANVSPHAVVTSTSQNPELRSLQNEIEELRRRDDLSRKLIHEKQMLLDTMFALSHQQNSPVRGTQLG